MKTKTTILFFATALLFIMACGKEQPSALQTTGQPAAQDYFKKFTVQWNPGTYLTGGRAQYAQTRPLEISGHAGAQRKVDLFIFDDDNSYILEYWELAGGKLQGALVQGRWFVTENGKLVLLQNGNDRVGEGTAVPFPDGKGGISLQFDSKFDVKKLTPGLIAADMKTPIIVFYTAGATGRTLPNEMRKNMSRQMSETNARGEHAFKD
jgi:hypothetical protein